MSLRHDTDIDFDRRKMTDQLSLLEGTHFVVSLVMKRLTHCFDVSLCRLQSTTEHFCVDDGCIGSAELASRSRQVQIWNEPDPHVWTETVGSVSQQNCRGTVHLGHSNDVRISRQGSRLQLVADLCDPLLKSGQALMTDVACSTQHTSGKQAGTTSFSHWCSFPSMALCVSRPVTNVPLIMVSSDRYRTSVAALSIPPVTGDLPLSLPNKMNPGFTDSDTASTRQGCAVVT